MSRSPDAPHRLQEQFARALTRHCRLRKGQKILVAVSGGADSLCLLHLLLEFRRQQGYPELHVAHLDHRVRGEAARRVASAVRRLSRRLGLGCTVEALPPWEASPSEDDLRRARHAFLERAADATGCRWIALAHHRRDQAETVLWNLARGTGRRGLGAMRHVVGRRIRPLLDLPADDLRTYLRARRQRWHEDEMNRSPLYTRNRVRTLLPLLERRVHPAAERNLARAAAVLGPEDELLESLAERRLQELTLHSGIFLALEAAPLRAEHPAMLRRVLRAAVRALSGGSTSLSWARTERLVELVLSRGGRIDLGGGYRAERLKRLLILRPQVSGASTVSITRPATRRPGLA
ncbi:MAG: tRNA lysidine(34) synthetase TilS [Acidobacteriota bacterium]